MMLADADSKTASTTDIPIITKKLRLEVIGESKQKYFRRSRVYVSTKVLLQHSLTMVRMLKVRHSFYPTANEVAIFIRLNSDRLKNEFKLSFMRDQGVIANVSKQALISGV